MRFYRDSKQEHLAWKVSSVLIRVTQMQEEELQKHLWLTIVIFLAAYLALASLMNLKGPLIKGAEYQH